MIVMNAGRNRHGMQELERYILKTRVNYDYHNV